MENVRNADENGNENSISAGRVHISWETHNFLTSIIGGYRTESRGEVIIKVRSDSVLSAKEISANQRRFRAKARLKRTGCWMEMRRSSTKPAHYNLFYLSNKAISQALPEDSQCRGMNFNQRAPLAWVVGLRHRCLTLGSSAREEDALLPRCFSSSSFSPWRSPG